MGLFERSTLQLMCILPRNEEKDKINSFSYTSKTHSTLGEKKIHFSLCRASSFFD